MHQHRNKVIINSVTLRYGTSTKLFILWNKLVVKFILFTVYCAVAVVHISIRLDYIGHCKWPKCAVLIIICNLWHHSLTHSLVRIHINWHLFAAVKQVARFCCPFKLFNRIRNAQYSHPLQNFIQMVEFKLMPHSYETEASKYTTSNAINEFSWNHS